MSDSRSRRLAWHNVTKFKAVYFASVQKHHSTSRLASKRTRTPKYIQRDISFELNSSKDFLIRRVLTSFSSLRLVSGIFGSTTMNSTTSPNDVNCPSMMSVRARRALFENSRTISPVSETGGSCNHAPNDASNRSNTMSTRNSLSTNGRQPLGFLSPNYKPRRLSRKGDNDTESKLKNKISDLQQQIHGFKNTTSNVEYKNDASSHPKRDEQLVELNKRLLQIQAGLVEIEGERCHLVSKAKQLEQEKESLKKQLLNREKEIEALQKRCVLAAEQGKESLALRSANHMLSKQVLDLSWKLDDKNDERICISELESQLKETQVNRDALKKQLEDTQKDHIYVCDELAKCMLTVDHLMSEKKEWENEKYRILQDTDKQLEQQRLDHIKATVDLRQELRARELKVQELDQLLREKVGSIQRLRNQLSQVKAGQADTLNQLNVEFDQKIQHIEKDLRTKVAGEVQQEMHHEMSALQAKLCEKTSEIESLRADVSTHMQELMVATSEVQKMQEDSEMLECLFRDVEALELERFELSETLHEKDTEIAELSAEILKLEIEKELSEQDSVKLRELKIAFDLVKQDCESSDARLTQVVDACNHLESEILRINTENDEAVARIRTDFDMTISEMQSKLQNAEDLLQVSNKCHTDVIVAKDEAIAQLGDQIDTIMLNYQQELSSLRDNLEKSALAWTVKEDELRSSCKRDLSDKDLVLGSLREEMKRMTEASGAKEAELRKKLDCAHERVMDLMSKCAKLEELTLKQASHHESEVSKLIANKAELLKEKEDLQCTIFEQTRRLDDFKVSGRKSVIRADTKISQLEEQIRQLKATTSDMENYSSVCSREHAFEVECFQQTISELEARNEASQQSIERYEEILQESREQLQKHQSAFDLERSLLEQRLKERDLKAVDLERESQARHLENIANVSKMEQTMASLQAEIEILKEKNHQLQENAEKSAENSSHEFQLSIGKMTATIDDLRRERDFSNISLQTCERKLEEERAERAFLAQRLDELQKSEISLRNDCRTLNLKMEEAQAERDKFELVLEQEMNRNHSDGDVLREQLVSTERTLVNYEEQMAQLEEALAERTTLVSEMMSSTKELQVRVDRSDVEYKTLEERSSLLQVRLLDKEDELKLLRSDWQHKEDDYLGEIHKERNAREILEADLAATIARLEAAKVESRDLSELEKENLTLKDKIRRQEAYLQRKIEQDKAVRERILLPGSHVKAAAVAKTPARVGCTQPRGIKSSSAASQSTRSTVPDTESTHLFDDADLDSLLAD
jgi:chromosome segregation ATPase